LRIADTEVEDTFAEAFRMRYVRLIVSAHDDHWLQAAATEFCGYGSSVIGCDAEAGVERRIDPRRYSEMGVDLEPSCFSVAAGSDQAKCAEELGTYLDICESGPCGGATGSGSGGPV